MTDQVKINKTTVSAYTIPTETPESDGTKEWDSTTIVIVEITAGNKTGFGYSYADSTAAFLINIKLLPILQNHNALDIPSCWEKMVEEVRNMGRAGIASTAISAVDIALWDLKAKIFNVPLVKLLGQRRKSIEVYGSGGFCSYDQDKLQAQLAGWVDEGIGAVKMKVGREPAYDLERVAAARDAIGPLPDLYIDANGAYSRKKALNFAYQCIDYNVSWFEEPVSSDDPEGMKMMRDSAPYGMEITTGEYGYDQYYFRNLLQNQTVDVLMADATRCTGITGFLQAATLSKAFNIPFSSHTAPSIHLHPALSLGHFKIAEYFYDHVRIEKKFFDGFISPSNGKLFPDLSRMGLGIELKHQDVEKYKVF